MKYFANNKRNEKQFEVAKCLLLRLQPYDQPNIVVQRCLKLAPKFNGPFQMLQMVGVVAYKLKLSPNAGIHNMFHVFQLNKYEGEDSLLSVMDSK